MERVGVLYGRVIVYEELFTICRVYAFLTVIPLPTTVILLDILLLNVTLLSTTLSTVADATPEQFSQLQKGIKYLPVEHR